MAGANAWFGIRIDLIAFVVLASLAFLSIFARDFDNVNPVMLSLLVTYLQYLQGILVWFLKSILEMQS